MKLSDVFLPKSVLTIVLMLFLLACSTNDDGAPKGTLHFDLQGVEAYFQIANSLANEVSLTNDEWDNFFTIKSNQLYLEENGIEDRRSEIQRGIEIVYTEKNDSIIKARSNENPYVLYHMRYKDSLEELNEFVKYLKNNSLAYSDTMLLLARAYLPKRMHQLDTFPAVYYHTLGEPSSGMQGMYFDIMVDYDCNQESFGSMAAHELHHQMRYTITEEITVDSQDKGIIYLLDAVLNEGVADLVDKQSLLSDSSEWWMKDLFEPIVSMTPDVINEIEKLIQLEAKGDHQSVSSYRQVLLNSSGHLPGYYMALKIKEHGKLEAMIKYADDPFRFFELYNNVVVENQLDIPRFSDSSMKYIRGMQKKYFNQ